MKTFRPPPLPAQIGALILDDAFREIAHLQLGRSFVIRNSVVKAAQPAGTLFDTDLLTKHQIDPQTQVFIRPVALSTLSRRRS